MPILSLEEARRHLHLPATGPEAQDDLLTTYIDSIENRISNMTDRVYSDGVFRQAISPPTEPASFLRCSHRDALGVTGIRFYLNASGWEAKLAADDYRVDILPTEGLRIHPTDGRWAPPDGSDLMEVTASVTGGTPPPAVRHAARLFLAELWDNRGLASAIPYVPPSVSLLLDYHVSHGPAPSFDFVPYP